MSLEMIKTDEPDVYEDDKEFYKSIQEYFWFFHLYSFLSSQLSGSAHFFSFQCSIRISMPQATSVLFQVQPWAPGGP